MTLYAMSRMKSKISTRNEHVERDNCDDQPFVISSIPTAISAFVTCTTVMVAFRHSRSVLKICSIHVYYRLNYEFSVRTVNIGT